MNKKTARGRRVLDFVYATSLDGHDRFDSVDMDATNPDAAAVRINEYIARVVKRVVGANGPGQERAGPPPEEAAAAGEASQA